MHVDLAKTQGEAGRGSRRRGGGTLGEEAAPARPQRGHGLATPGLKTATHRQAVGAPKTAALPRLDIRLLPPLPWARVLLPAGPGPGLLAHPAGGTGTTGQAAGVTGGGLLDGDGRDDGAKWL